MLRILGERCRGLRARDTLGLVAYVSNMNITLKKLSSRLPPVACTRPNLCAVCEDCQWLTNIIEGLVYPRPRIRSNQSQASIPTRPAVFPGAKAMHSGRLCFTMRAL